MARMATARRPGAEASLSRRDFLAGTTAAAAAIAAHAGEAVLAAPTTQPTRTSTHPTVVQTRSDIVVNGRRVHPRVLAAMLDAGLTRLTGAPTSQEAWRRILKPDDVVGLKFNRSGAKELGTTEPLADALIQSLMAAGWDPARIVPIEVSPSTYDATRTSRPVTDWDDYEVDFGSGKDELASVLRQVTALVNVPFLKTHNIAGMTACLKNLSHALVKHPARFHGNRCSPYVGDIVALPQIRGKLRLNIVNALRIVFDGGPEVSSELTWPGGILLMGCDPVAVDTVGTELLNRVRKRNGLASLDADGGGAQYVEAAAARGLGCSELYQIDLTSRVL
jgi:hypothetical protein